MAATIPTTTSQWTMAANEGFDGLRLEEKVPLPELKSTECLIKIEAASLNYRNIAISTGKYIRESKVRIIPGSDGAGTIILVGSEDGFITQEILGTSLGSHRDGVLRQYAVFDETTLVPAPNSLSLREASTLPCAATTAGNALYWMFAAQIALAAGATVTATISSDVKGEELKKLGVHHVINYKADPSWGETAKKLTKDGQGLDHIN
ncbi:hypothetical protein AC579_5105 [Pseudocercospora musae]|uniref:Enoyl reductase (ER) domain-containing protein n=1 Tax=Pseudocercospora musae TaxID=113226 RepID=A0A139INI1_9PEZI|nr:hypothetical protein AC579_5105 [Pseudocercospora musae]